MNSRTKGGSNRDGLPGPARTPWAQMTWGRTPTTIDNLRDPHPSSPILSPQGVFDGALAGYIGARVEARYEVGPDRETVVLTVDLDRTGGPGGPESRFFSDQPMRWTLYAPGRNVVRVADGQGRALNYYIDAPGVWTVEFPPFGSRSEQRMTVTLRRP